MLNILRNAMVAGRPGGEAPRQSDALPRRVRPEQQVPGVLVTPAKRGKGNRAKVSNEPHTPAQRRAAMTWAKRLKRVFNLVQRAFP